MKRTIIIAPAVLVAAVLIPVSEADDKKVDQDAKPAKRPTLAALKKLVGDWVTVDKDGKPTDNVVSSFRITAGGSAVVETVFPGQRQEMLTVYHPDGDELMLTHYCALGNQPRMKAEPDSGPNKLVFNCIGGTNMKSEKVAHMHQGIITFIDDDHIRSVWHLHTDGKTTYTADHKLVRRRNK